MQEFLTIYFPFYFLAVLMVVPYSFKSDILEKRSEAYDTLLTCFLAISLIILFGFRDYELGTDTMHYVRAYEQIQFAETFHEALNTSTAFSTKDPFFNIFTYYVGLAFGMRGYFVVLAILYVVPILLIVFRLTGTHRSLMFLCFMGLIAFPNMGINIVRSAVSLSLGLFSLMLFMKKQRKAAIIMGLFSFSFHFSSLLIFAAAIVTLLNIPLYIYLSGLFACTLLSYLGLGIENLPYIGELILAQDRLSGYISGDRVSGSLSPFIVLFYFLTIIVGLFFYSKIEDNNYLTFLKIFITLTGFYFLTFNLNDSYRFGFIAAIFTPLVICYPSLNYHLSRGANFIPVGCIVLFLGILAYYRTG